MMNNAVKSLILAAIAGIGIYTAATMEETVLSTFTPVSTVTMSRAAYRKSVSARGSIYSDGGKWYAAAFADESDASLIAEGQTASVTGAGFEGSLDAVVRRVSDTAHTDNGKTTVEVIIEITGDCGNLKSGYTAESRIYVDEARLLNILPYGVIRQDENGEYVYVIENSRAKRCDIETGIELSDGTEITGGISENSEIISCPDRVSENIFVRKEES